MLQNLPLGDTLEFCAYKSQYFKQIYSWQEILGVPYSINTAFILHQQVFKLLQYSSLPGDKICIEGKLDD